VALTKRIYLIDCPGVVCDVGDSDTDKVLKSVLRCEKIEDPTMHIHGILTKVKKETLQSLYGVMEWEDHEDFVSKAAFKYGKLLRGAEPDLKAMSKIILMDWQRGKIPYFVLPQVENNNNNLNVENNNELEVNNRNDDDMFLENENKHEEILDDNKGQVELSKNSEFKINQLEELKNFNVK